jgi:NADH-quinone oxidoreductase subunit N
MLLVLSVLSMVLGNLVAIAQTNLKRMLAYSAIAQIGFVLLGMLSGIVGGSTNGAADAWSASMFYLVAYVLTTLGTFGVMMLMSRDGHEAEDIADLKGLGRRNPALAFVMLILMFSLAGIPPTIGFYAKLAVLKAVIDAGEAYGRADGGPDHTSPLPLAGATSSAMAMRCTPNASSSTALPSFS